MSEGSKSAAVTITFTVLATVFVILRLVSRVKLLRRSSVDDYLIILAVALAWVLTGLIYIRELEYEHICLSSADRPRTEIQFGLGKHQDHVSLEDFEKILLVRL